MYRILYTHYQFIVAPSAPRLLNVTSSTATSVTLSWLPPDPPNGPLSIYEVTYGAEGTTSPSRQFVLAALFRTTSLQSGVVYVVSVRASTIGEDATLIFGTAATLRIMNGVLYYT